MRALVLCAGYGTRLGTYTQDVPKPMLPLGGKPLLHHTLQYLKWHGFGEVAVNLHYMGESIVAYFGDGSQLGVKLHYSHEPTLLGTAGAIRKLDQFFAGEENFLVLYGDLLIDQDLSELVHKHRERRAGATLLLHKRSSSNSCVQLDADHRITTFLERPSEQSKRSIKGESWVNSGVQILSRRIIGRIPSYGVADLARDVYPACLQSERIYGVPLSGFRCAIDSPRRYEEAECAITEGRYGAPWATGADAGSDSLDRADQGVGDNTDD